MKFLQHLLAAVLLFTSFAAYSQKEMPKGFANGMIVLGNGDTLTGLLKDNIRKEAAVVFISEAGGKKKTYQGSGIMSAEINDVRYLCIKGDFFKIVCEGNLCFLQKASDASNIPTYNGTEAIFSNGTEGRPGDYFFYSATAKTLKMISGNTIEAVAVSSFAGCTAAIDKAKAVKSDFAQLKDAVEIYNNSNNK
ncbi:MAG: hypothetical protein ABIN67_06930 [Ferruginibacter sp.]